MCPFWLVAAQAHAQPAESSGGWTKYSRNPVLGGKLGTCFDVSVLRQEGKFRLWFSWRPKRSIALVESADGVHWSVPRIALGPNPSTDWESDVNRPSVLRHNGLYRMWYTGQAKNRSWIGYATSPDGVRWTRASRKPVLSAQGGWEKNTAVMCPDVVWDSRLQVYRMWYSGGDQYEPDAIGYATSPDGLQWTKSPNNPVFRPAPNHSWESDRVTGCQVVREGDWWVMFYIGFANQDFAQIGLARSRDGISGWQRNPANPILRARVRPDDWDFDACYKPYAIFDQGRWLLWYNGRRGSVEQIGMAIHPGRDLWPTPNQVPERTAKKSREAVLHPEAFRHYVDAFNLHDWELYPQAIRNNAAWDFMRGNIPWFNCPDHELEQIYYFRWWTYRKHIEKTPEGFVITEFLPKVGWAGKYNTISCAAGHHFYEGRWLRNPRYLEDYARFWFRGGGDPRRYSFWAADALWAWYRVHPEKALLIDLLPDLISNHTAWQNERRDPNGLFWQYDGQDGMEVSIGGSGYRATINSYMYGDDLAIAHIANLAGKPDEAKVFRKKAALLKHLVLEHLWNDRDQFFEVLPRGAHARLVGVRELHGYTPWYFGLPDPAQGVAWRQVMDPKGFYAPYGLTTAEQRSPRFALSYQGHECQWNGPSWPYATSVTLTALANFLNGPSQDVIRRKDYFKLLKIYAHAQHRCNAKGETVPWIDENLNPLTGDWIARTRLRHWKDGTWDPAKGGVERGKDYNHSTFCDLIITGLVGLRPRADDILEVNPLLPKGLWDWFCLDGVSYHGRNVTILWDKTGRHYHHGSGLRLFSDGRELAHAPELRRIAVSLP